MGGKRASYSLNKGTLAKKKKELTTYKRYLPALELKQQQLMAEQKKERKKLLFIQSEQQKIGVFVEQQLPMLASDHFRLDGLVQLEAWDIQDEYIIGVALPTLKKVIIKKQSYGLLARPHWVDNVVDLQEKAIRLALSYHVQMKRVEILARATQSATQRVNLFSKILVPETKQAIKKIQVYVSDSEAAAVVRSKITKKKTAQFNAINDKGS